MTQTVTVDVSRAATWRARRCASGPPPRRLWCASTTGTSTGSVNSMHDSYTPLGGMTLPGQHDARRGQPGRRRRRACTACWSSRCSRCSSPASWSANTGVPRQEDPGRRDEAGRALHPRRCRSIVLVGFADLDVRELGARTSSIFNPGAARLHRDHLRVHLGGATTTARRSPASPRNTAVDQHHARRSRCWSAGSS